MEITTASGDRARVPALYRLAGVVLASAYALVSQQAIARDVDCDYNNGPDVIVGDMPGIVKWGTIGDTTAYTVGSAACNIGDVPLPWERFTNQHPLFTPNLYRLKNGRLEQIGMGWCKHGFMVVPGAVCCPCDQTSGGQQLTPGCSDVYSASLNGNQSGNNGSGGLGPRSDVNPYSGVFSFPYPTQGQTGDLLYKRLQVKMDDLDPAQNPGAEYFLEGIFVDYNDAQAGNENNNVTYIKMKVLGFSAGGYDLDFDGPPVRGAAAVHAWEHHDPSVSIDTVTVPGDGRFIVACKASPNGNGTWHYEYAIFNQSSDRAARSFTVPIPPGVLVTGVGFHDVHYHSGEPYSGANWAASSPGLGGGQVTWTTGTFGSNPNANALRWGTTYTFRFDASAGPSTESATIGLFKPGSPGFVTASVYAPSTGGGGGGGGGGETPENDACNDAITIGFGATAFTNANASTDGPSGGGTCAASLQRDIWFKFHSTFTGRLRVQTCNSVDYNSTIAVYDNCSCSSFDLLACNDDSCGDASKVVVDVEAGRCYLIRVGGSGGAMGNGWIKLSCADGDNAARADRVAEGASSGDLFGCSLAAAGRVDFGGNADLIVGSYRYDPGSGSNAGRAGVLRGDDLELMYGFNGAAANDRLGWSVAGGGDANGDGRADLIAGAAFNDEGGTDAGKIYVYSGSSGALLWTAKGKSDNDRFGCAVAFVGDVNGDGRDDVLVGAPYNDSKGSNAGRAYLYSGANGAIIRKYSGSRAGDLFGFAVAGIGDLDDDGVPDYAIGSPRNDHAGQNAGRVSIYSGFTGKLIKRLHGEAPNDRFGSALAGRRFNADGDRSFLIVGSPYSGAGGASSGQVIVYSHHHHGSNPCSKPLCVRDVIDGKKPGDRFGYAVALADITGNAIVDYIIGAPYADDNGDNSGSVYIYDGESGSLDKRWQGEAPGDKFGWSVAGAGDINDDGREDFAAGSPRNDAAGSSAGRAYVFFSPTGGGAAAQARSFNPDQPLEGPEPAIHPADLDLNGVVDAADLLLLLADWGTCESSYCPADLSPDGGDASVGPDDLAFLLGAWGM